jgi:DNA-binding transcriptional MerR regulator
VPTASDPSDKLYLKIGEVAAQLGVKPYVLRYWESEFSVLKPVKARSKHRLYRPRDVAILREIKRLLYDERLTIEGAKKRFKTPSASPRRKRASTSSSESRLRATLENVRTEIEQLCRMLS